jgi:hypothetical protein
MRRPNRSLDLIVWFPYSDGVGQIASAVSAAAQSVRGHRATRRCPETIKVRRTRMWIVLLPSVEDTYKKTLGE